MLSVLEFNLLYAKRIRYLLHHVSNIVVEALDIPSRLVFDTINKALIDNRYH